MRTHCHLCGTQYPDSPGNPWTCSECSNVAYDNPVPSTLVILFNDADEVLVAKRGIEPYKGRYSLPGGFVDVGETLDQALQREITEELGLRSTDYTDLQYVANFTADYPFSKEIKTVLCTLFTARLTTNKTITASDDVAAVQFCSIDALDSVDFARPFLPVHIRTAHKILRSKTYIAD